MYTIRRYNMETTACIDFILIYFIRFLLMSHIKLYSGIIYYSIITELSQPRIYHTIAFACFTTQSRLTIYFNEIFAKKCIKLGLLYTTIIIIAVKFYNIYVDMVYNLKSRALSTF